MLFNSFLRKNFNSIRNFSTHVDLVVIGGGVSGASTLYNCSELGLQGILLEKDKITAGTTWHSAGLHWNCRPNFNDIETSMNTTNMIQDIEKKISIFRLFFIFQFWAKVK